MSSQMIKVELLRKAAEIARRIKWHKTHNIVFYDPGKEVLYKNSEDVSEAQQSSHNHESGGSP